MEFEVFCKNEECRSTTLFGTEGKTYHIEEKPQKMLEFDKFKIGTWESYSSGMRKGKYFQYYCPVCFTIKTIVVKGSKIINLYEDTLEEHEE